MSEPDKKKNRQVLLDQSQVLDLTSETEENNEKRGKCEDSSKDTLPLASHISRLNKDVENATNIPIEINNEIMGESTGPPETELDSRQNRHISPGAVWVRGIEAEEDSAEDEHEDNLLNYERQEHEYPTVLSAINPDQLHREVIENMPQATVAATTAKPSHRVIYYVVIALAIIAIGSVATLVLLLKDDTNDVGVQIDKDDELLSLLIRRSDDLYKGESKPSTLPLFNETSPQYRAFEWLRDRTKIILKNDTLMQASKRDLSNAAVREEWLINNYVLRIIYESAVGEDWVIPSDFNWFDSPTLDYCTYVMQEAFAPLYASIDGYVPCDMTGEITLLSLVRLGLGTRIPEEVGLMTSLLYMGFQKNGMKGPIPQSLGQLSRLQALDITTNELTGTLPTELGSLTNLVDFLVHENPNLEGGLPTEYASMTSLRTLTMHRTNLVGSVSESVCETWNTTNELHGGAASFTSDCWRFACSCCTRCVEA